MLALYFSQNVLIWRNTEHVAPATLKLLKQHTVEPFCDEEFNIIHTYLRIVSLQ